MESELNRAWTHRDALPGRSSTRQAGGGGGLEGKDRCFLAVLSMLNAGERQLYCPGVGTSGLPLLKRSLGLTNKEVMLPIIQRQIWGDTF